MSSKAAPTPIPPPTVSDAYRKAHKNYVFVAGLLGAWQLIGINLATKEKWGIELKSPAGVPVVLGILVFYFGYKVWIEWKQCDPGARLHDAARLDYVVAHLIAGAAVLVTAIQYFWRIQLINLLTTRFGNETLAIMSLFLVGGMLLFLREARNSKPWWTKVPVFSATVASVLLWVGGTIMLCRKTSPWHTFVVCGIGLVLFTGLAFVYDRLLERLVDSVFRRP